ncbi:MAG: WYL domain-containing protein [Anaerolineae bacterium]|jgi:hypothetical protein|nr:WYL domain-containing protein [Anaerolineae bacterium]
MPDQTVAAVEVTWPLSTQVFLHDVARCLALVHQGELRLDHQGQLQPDSLQRLAAALCLPLQPEEPGSEAQAPVASFVVGLVGAAGFVADVGGTLRLSDAGNHWLGAPPTFQVRQLRDAWWLNPEANARWLPPTRHRRPGHSRGRRVLLEAAAWAAALPPSEWTPSSAFGDHLASLGLLSAAGNARNLPRARRAARRRLLALAGFLFRTPFSCLGLVDTRAEEGELWLRPTAQGIAWLRAALERAHLLAHAPSGAAVELAVPAQIPPFPPADAPAFAVALAAGRREPGLAIAIRPHAPALCTFEVAHLARLQEQDAPPNGAPLHYCLTRDSLSQALAWGYSLSDALFLLDRFADHGLPPDAADLLRAWEQEMTAVTWEAGFRLTAATPGVLASLRRRDSVRRRTEPFASGRDAWVSRAEAPGLWTYLRRTGHDLRLPGDLNDWPLQPRLREPLPLAPLLVILRTYGELRRLVPGLSVLGTEELEQALAASLLEDDLAGVRRLVESHATLMAHYLKCQPVPAEGGDGEGADAALSGDDDGADGPLDELSARLQAAIDAHAELDLTYADTQGKVTHRRIRPLHLDLRWGRRYLLAHCQLRDEDRHFRLDRIVQIAAAE